ncbi:TolC family protein [Maridesulfovibrio frigidus]|uniref:TolC family protein n=1 Tax=Maridesulfovibrio frigidus TaxID=340956 RepID=UPI0004E1AC63|nr:TolC family protein [Maridesulfovibrio frigidus]
MRFFYKLVMVFVFAAALSVTGSPLFGFEALAQKVPASNVGSPSSGIVALSEVEFLTAVSRENESIRRQTLEMLIAKEGIENAWGLFEPMLEMSFAREYEREQNDADQAAIRSNESIYQRNDNVGSMGVSSLLPTGTSVELVHELRDPSTSLQDSDQYGRQREVKVGVAVSQPLLKNFGTNVNLTKVRIAESEHKIAELHLDRARLIAVFKAGQSYYDMLLAQTKLTLEAEMLALAREIAGIVSKQVQEGRVPTSAIFRSESSLARRKARYHFAEKAVRRSASNIRQMLVGTSLATNSAIRVSNLLPELDLAGVYSEMSRKEVLENRPDYLAAKLELDLEGERVEYADNQNFWDVSLDGEYGQTGMGRNWDDAYDKLGSGFEYWTVGATISVPLGGGVSEESALEAAKRREDQASLSLTNLSGIIVDELETSRKEVGTAYDEAKGLARVVDFQRKVLEDGYKLFKQGRIARSDLIVQEQEFIESELIMAEKLVEFKKAILTLWLAEGRLCTACKISEGA